jgi:hypothetical protein
MDVLRPFGGRGFTAKPYGKIKRANEFRVV